MKKIIITGSSGFIGSILRDELLNQNFEVIGIDIIPSNVRRPNYLEFNFDISTQFDYIPPSLLSNVSCVCHLAAKIRVDESMKNPEMYYKHNVIGTINLLNWCLKNNIKNILFASTAAVYGKLLEEGTPGYVEEDVGNPVSVYGQTKLTCEEIIKSYSSAYGFKGYIFRFFNVCGGSELNHGTPIHLLPLIINNILHNKDIQIFGTDYKTKDGTCVRDYIHLKDISRAFLLSIDKGFEDGIKTYNLGSGEGFTVKEIVDKIVEYYSEKGKTINVLIRDRRSGDFDMLIANSNLIKKELGWYPEHELNKMISDTINSFSV